VRGKNGKRWKKVTEVEKLEEAGTKEQPMGQWYYGSQGNRFGPVSLEELRQLAFSGRLQSSDYVIEEGMPTWVQAGSVAGLFQGAPGFAPGPGLVPPAFPTVGTGKATASLVLGIIGLLAWLLPIIGAPVTITGLVLGIQQRRSSAKGMATAGIVLCIIGLALTVGNGAVGCYLGMTGQHPLVNRMMR
jgi:hypothetical protein